MERHVKSNFSKIYCLVYSAYVLIRHTYSYIKRQNNRSDIYIYGYFELGKVPSQWTTGIINPLLKAGINDDRNPLNYRGITLISVPSKIYASVLNTSFTKWLDINDILCDEQNRFHRNRSCEDHIYSLYSVINDRKISRQSTYVCFVDLKKAFDSVNRHLLWYKLARTGIDGKFIGAVTSLYENVNCCVKINNDRTPWFKVSSGVKQGFVLSTTLFSLSK